MKIDAVCLNLKAENFDDAVRELVQELDLPDLKKEKIVAEVISRESKASTFMGNQSALPHCKTAEISGIMVVFGRKDTPIMFGANKDKATKLIFLIISSESEIRGHLRVLASLAKPIKNKEHVVDLMAASSKEEVEDILERP